MQRERERGGVGEGRKEKVAKIQRKEMVCLQNFGCWLVRTFAMWFDIVVRNFAMWFDIVERLS